MKKKLRVERAEQHGWGIAVYFGGSHSRAFFGHSKMPGYRWFGTFREAQAYCREVKEHKMRARPVRVRVRMELAR